MINNTEKVDSSKIAILIPSYNECNHIGEVIKKCSRFNLDIIVINDGSTDNTNEVVKELKTHFKDRLTVINHNINKGKGEALKTGFNHIINNNYYGAITIDADGQHDPEEIQKFLDNIAVHNPDLIVGSRFNNTKGMPFIRRFVNYLTSWIISGIAGRKIEDVQSGFRFLNQKVLKNIKLETKNFDTEPEMLLRASWSGFSIRNIPIKTIYNLEEFKSHVNPVKDTIKFFKLVFTSIRWKRKALREIKNKNHL